MERQGALRSDQVAPNELTQAGMVVALGANQSSLAHVLRSLGAAGVVAVDVRHARGRAKRVRVYSLTPRGESLARELRNAATAHARTARRSPSPGGEAGRPELP
jgi:DNA-binding PadR family transcriptional regulator